MRLDKHFGGENKAKKLSTILDTGKDSVDAVKTSKNVSRLLRDIVHAVLSEDNNIYDYNTFYYAVSDYLIGKGYKNNVDGATINEIISSGIVQIAGACKGITFAEGNARAGIKGLVVSILANLAKEKIIALTDVSAMDHIGAFLSRGKTLVITGKAGYCTGYRSCNGSTIIADDVEDSCAFEAQGTFIIKHAGDNLGDSAYETCKIYAITAERSAGYRSEAKIYLYSAKADAGAESGEGCRITAVKCKKTTNIEDSLAIVRIRSKKYMENIFRKVGLNLDDV